MTTDEHRPAVELVVLLASAGGLDALSIVLRDLPPEFPPAIVVQQHLGGISSMLPGILGKHTPQQVTWAKDGQAIVPGQVVVCPPGVHMELTPDGRCRLGQLEALGERRFDMLLASVAKSYGPRSVAVVLSGSGHDGAVGTVAMKRAGAIVIAQSPDTARYPSMPMAAAKAGADLVVPVHEIGNLLVDIVAGAPLPKPRPRDKDHEKGSAAIFLNPFPQRADDGSGDNATAAEAMTMGTENSAAARARMAQQRAAELQRRRRDLSTGFGATAESVAVARRRAGESLRRAQLAHQAAEEAAARWGH
jgi:two-component system chemotaxis response regulator CheB